MTVIVAMGQVIGFGLILAGAIGTILSAREGVRTWERKSNLENETRKLHEAVLGLISNDGGGDVDLGGELVPRAKVPMHKRHEMVDAQFASFRTSVDLLPITMGDFDPTGTKVVLQSLRVAGKNAIGWVALTVFGTFVQTLASTIALL